MRTAARKIPRLAIAIAALSLVPAALAENYTVWFSAGAHGKRTALANRYPGEVLDALAGSGRGRDRAHAAPGTSRPRRLGLCVCAPDLHHVEHSARIAFAAEPAPRHLAFRARDAAERLAFERERSRKLGFGKASHLRGRQVDALAEACGGGKHLIWRYLLHWQSLYNF